MDNPSSNTLGTGPKATNFYKAKNGTIDTVRVTRKGGLVFRDIGNLFSNVLDRHVGAERTEEDAEQVCDLTRRLLLERQGYASRKPRSPLLDHVALIKQVPIHLKRQVLNFEEYAYLIRPVKSGVRIDALFTIISPMTGTAIIRCGNFICKVPKEIWEFFPPECPPCHVKIFLPFGSMLFNAAESMWEFTEDAEVLMEIFDLAVTQLLIKGVQAINPPTFLRSEYIRNTFRMQSLTADNFTISLVKPRAVENLAGLVNEMQRLSDLGVPRFTAQRVDTAYDPTKESSNVLSSDIYPEIIKSLKEWV